MASSHIRVSPCVTHNVQRYTQRYTIARLGAAEATGASFPRKRLARRSLTYRTCRSGSFEESSEFISCPSRRHSFSTSNLPACQVRGMRTSLRAMKMEGGRLVDDDEHYEKGENHVEAARAAFTEELHKGDGKNMAALALHIAAAYDAVNSNCTVALPVEEFQKRIDVLARGFNPPKPCGDGESSEVDNQDKGDNQDYAA
eukprot:CAMPEP_0198221768 /NCGR_PEP_ID=MMETSP1445-20131203/85218_1 /TAXON_ID=36898 /ORGANISM="Pyramimonas sp., Strain CCMP2087" /LENGTH=199 /DNA_ID=CAMNT_0043900037 /DNA_START=177 /DNA_END=773 /DNA_ORIENTATION=+